MNRHERRKKNSIGKNLAAKIRCSTCNSTTSKMSKEHFFPRWLIKRSNIKHGIKWSGKKGVSPKSATVPLCEKCNHTLGDTLESPVMKAFDEVEAGLGLTAIQCELLVRWMWKFETIAWQMSNPDKIYSAVYTPIGRILGDGFESIKRELILAIGLINGDPNEDDLPMGFDSPIGGANAIFISGVFCQVAIIVSLKSFANMIPPSFSIYKFEKLGTLEVKKVFFPERTFVGYNQAIAVTSEASVPLWLAHSAFAEAETKHEALILPTRPKRIELPASYFRPHNF